MNRQKGTKINYLLKNWPLGTVAVYSWFNKNCADRKLVQQYLKSGWIERLGRGAFKRAGENVDWMGAVYAMQQQMKKTVHPAGKTALQLLGLAHYVPANFKMGQVNLFGSEKETLPAWFKKHDWGVSINYIMSGLFREADKLGLTAYDAGGYEIKISSAERAALEFCYAVPEKESFVELDEIMSSLVTLRPGLVQELLVACRSVKVKRLFMYLAEKHEHPWVKRIDIEKIDFGKGKRALCKNGKYNPKYKLVVPK